MVFGAITINPLFNTSLSGARPYLIFQVNDSVRNLAAVSYEVTSSSKTWNLSPEVTYSSVIGGDNICKYRLTETLTPGAYTVKVKASNRVDAIKTESFNFTIVTEDAARLWITPNPCTANQVKIKYFLSRYCEQVIIRIYDKSGRMIFFDDQCDTFSSYNEYLWNKVFSSGKTVPQGTYYIVMEAYSDQKKSHKLTGTVSIIK